MLLPLLIAGLWSGFPQAPEPFQISVNVNLVVLNATVRDKRGEPVSGLHEPDFEVYENGVRQSIRVFQQEDLPVTVGLLVDHSGSMRARLSPAVEGARAFVRASSPQDEMFVVNFNEHVTLGLPESRRFSNRPDELALAISHEPATGQTALYDAIFKARELLRSGTHEKKALLIISDGGDNASTHTLAEVLKLADRSNAVIYTIGIFEDQDPDKNPEVLRRLAAATGGEAFFPREPAEIVAICNRIAQEIRQQYTLGYVPSERTKSDAYRSVRVTARNAGKKLVVRTRSGYSGPGQ